MDLGAVSGGGVLGAGGAGGGGVPPPNAASFVFAVTELTRLLFHRREAEDVGVRGRGRGLRAPHIHSVYDIPSLVSPTRSPRLRHHSSSSPPPPPWCFQSVTSIFCSTPPPPMPQCLAGPGESSTYCVQLHRSLQAQDANGAAVWGGRNAHEMVYTCPECQEPAHSSCSS